MQNPMEKDLGTLTNSKVKAFEFANDKTQNPKIWVYLRFDRISKAV